MVNENKPLGISDAKTNAKIDEIKITDKRSANIEPDEYTKKGILKNEKRQEKIKDIKLERELRENYADKTFKFLICFNIIYFILIECIIYFKHEVHSWVLVSIIGTIPASMALFGWVLKGLSPQKIT